MTTGSERQSDLGAWVSRLLGLRRRNGDSLLIPQGPVAEGRASELEGVYSPLRKVDSKSSAQAILEAAEHEVRACY